MTAFKGIDTSVIAAPNAKRKTVVLRSDRRMVRAKLSGQHEHVTGNGQAVQIWKRGGRFLARARWQNKQIGVTLGADEQDAGHALRRLLTNMEDGTFVSGKDARQQRFSNKPVPRWDLRGLVNTFLMEKLKLKGRETARAYGNRLMYAVEFAELPTSKKRWQLAACINRDFAIEFRTSLFQRDVTRNGKSGGRPKRMSATTVRLCLETLRAVLCWAARPDVRQLPAGFTNPISEEIVGSKPDKDPSRPNPIPMANRIRMVEAMDAWQLCHLTPLALLPLRFEDLAGAVVADVDLADRSWTIGTRLQGNDFTKGRMTWRLPLPIELCDVLAVTIGERTNGPLFRSRADWSGRKQRRLRFDTPDEFAALCESGLHQASGADVATEQDRKALVRSILRRCGGVSTDIVARELRLVYRAAGIADGVRPYDVRAAVTDDMHRADLRHLELRYLTGHTVNDILKQYTGLDPVGEMQKYFRRIEPLLRAVRRRADELGFFSAR